MLDIKFIRENTKQVKTAVKHKNINIDIDKLLQLDEQRREFQQKIDELRARRNELAEAGRGGKPTAEQVSDGKKLKAEIARLETEFTAVEEKYKLELSR